MYHHRKTRRQYKSFSKPATCQFCDSSQIAVIISETPHARIVKNRVGYDMWDLQGVIEHLMVTPKRHVRSLAELTEAERLDVINFIAEYESRGYNIHARAPQSPSRSVEHQHTHLIKTNKKLIHMSFYMERPYISVKF